MFQALPLHIVCAIVNYVLLFDTQPPLDLDTDNHTVDSHDIWPLLQISRVYRYSVLNCLLKWTSINIISSEQFDVKSHLWPLSKLDYSLLVKYTRVLNINVCCSLLSDASVLKLRLEKFQFHAIKRLCIVFEDFESLQGNLVAEYYNSVMEIVCNMVPQPMKLKICYGKTGCYMDYGNYCHIADDGLLKIYRNIYPFYEAKLLCIPNEVRPKSSSLSAIEIFQCVNAELTCQFIRCNSATLKELKVRFSAMQNCISIFYDPNLRFIPYSKLTKLIIRADNHDHHSSLLDIPYRQLYPKLEYLYMEKLYPFTNAALLSKSSNSLAYLHLGCDKRTMEMFKFNQKFTKVNFSRLKYLTLSQTPASPLYEIDIKDLVQFAFSTLPHIQKVELSGTKTYSNLFSTIADMNISANITRLSIRLYTVTINDMAVALQAFPQLESLECLSIRLGGLSAAEGSLAEYVYAKLHFPNARLRTIKTWDVNQSINVQAFIFMLIAVMCPSFTVINMRRRRIAAFEKEIEMLMSKFASFQSRLNLVVRNR